MFRATLAAAVLLACWGPTRSLVLFQRDGVNVKAIDAFAGEDTKLPCFIEQRMNNRSGRPIPDERRALWEINRVLLGEKIEGRAFFIPKHSEIPLTSDDAKEDGSLVIEGGDASGELCHFPFTAYDNRTDTNTTHYACTDTGKDDHRCWCSSKRIHSATTWGFCPCPGPVDGITLYAEYGTDPGMPCVFPFYYKEKKFRRCTRQFDDHDRCWCATVKHMDDKENNKFGYCPCAAPPLIGEWGEWDVWKKAGCGQVTYRKRVCQKPKGMIQVGIGRKPFCAGSSFDFKLFECDVYTSPFDDYNLIDLQKRSRRGGKKRDDNSVVIKEISEDDAGFFQCKVTTEHLPGLLSKYVNPRKLVASYVVNVVDKSAVVEVFYDKGEKLSLPTSHGAYRLKYIWTPWSECNRCALWKGETRASVFCYAMDERENRYLPCKSPLLTVLQRESLSKLPDYVVYKSCRSRCPSRVIRVKAVPGEDAPKIRVANRDVIRANYGDSVSMDCTRNRTKFPAWQYDHVDGKLAAPIYIKDNKPQMYIDVHGMLHLDDLADEVAGYYSCFIDTRLRRSYRLFVGQDTSIIENRVESSPPYVRIALIVVIFGLIGHKVARTKME